MNVRPMIFFKAIKREKWLNSSLNKSGEETMTIPKIRDSKTGKYLAKKIEEGKTKISNLRKKPCPCHYFTGDHFVKKDCDLDENGHCALCGQRFDADGEPINVRTTLNKTVDKYLYEHLFFCPKAEF